MIDTAFNWACDMPSEVASLVALLMSGLAQLTILPDDRVLRLAVYSALALALLTLVVMSQVVVLSELASRREARRRGFIAAWRPHLAAWSLEAEDKALPAPPRSRQERIWFLLLWSRVQRQLRGTAQQRLNVLLERLGMIAPVLGLLESRAVHRRLVALACLRHLADVAHWSAVSPLLDSRNVTISLAAAQTLVAMDPERAMQRIMSKLEERRDWAMPRLEALCQQAGRQAVTAPLLDRLSAPRGGTTRAVALLWWAEPGQAAPWARRLLADQSASHEVQELHDESRCAALRSLGELRDPRDRDLLVAHLDDEAPAVRLAALAALRRQASVADQALIASLLADPNWWVRQAAADALVALPDMDDAALTTLLASLTDRYGQDALRRAMAEGRR
ncbi:HEAT repeat-containing protein [Franzmannia pantelleriensis]|uniref:HEAT repeat-containing protein n=1 Tax=Franzmannia pantelleriensis TaxID=48727 RepID=A0A1G9M6C7_9GAMM|nr:HEAT repeat domain-containing protein [Halomonas pantelleriensis]SDL69694.1 HEAT repeat-containing protein [Halomonas pantelleriensis]